MKNLDFKITFEEPRDINLILNHIAPIWSPDNYTVALPDILYLRYKVTTVPKTLIEIGTMLLESGIEGKIKEIEILKQENQVNSKTKEEGE